MLATKVYGGDGRLAERRHASRRSTSAQACEDSLRRLQTDHIDLYQMHHIDRDTPWDEIWQAMDSSSHEGKVIYVGSSNFAGWHIAQAQRGRQAAATSSGLVSRAEPLQPRRSRTVELEVLPACRGVWAGRHPVEPAGGRPAGRRARKASEGAGGAEEGSAARSRSSAPQLEAWEELCARARRGAGRRRAGLAAAQPGRDRADHRPAHDGAARGRRCGARRSSSRRDARQARRDLPGPGGRPRRPTPGKPPVTLVRAAPEALVASLKSPGVGSINPR